MSRLMAAALVPLVFWFGIVHVREYSDETTGLLLALQLGLLWWSGDLEFPEKQSVPVSLLTSGVPLLLFFWLLTDFPFACAITGFLLLLGLGVSILPGKFKESSAENTTVKQMGRFGKILLFIWFFSPVGALIGWILTDLIDITLSNWRTLFAIRATFVLVPLICALPLFRYVRGRTKYVGLAIIACWTALPVLTGLQSAVDLLRGPEWEAVNIAGVDSFSGPGWEGKTFNIYHMHHADDYHVSANKVYFQSVVLLSDGRKLTPSEEVTLHLGASQILVLRKSQHILAAR